MVEGFRIIGKDGVGKGDNFYDLSIHPSLTAIPAEMLASFRGMNASILKNHEDLPLVYSEHVVNSKNAILLTADRALSRVPEGKRKRALILGAGNCLDIPLPQLTDTFDEVTLVEVDYESTEKAVKALTLERQRKTKIIAADITGVVGEFGSSMQQSMDLSLPEFLIRSAEAVRDIDVRDKVRGLGEDYTFVSSQLVWSQLASLPHNFLNKAARERYRAILSDQPGGLDNDLFVNFQQFMLDLQQEHLRQLNHLAAPEGTVHLADTYAKLVPIPNTTNAHMLPMILTKFLDPQIGRYFTEVPQEPYAWLWDSEPGKYKYLVVARSFDPKPTI